MGSTVLADTLAALNASTWSLFTSETGFSTFGSQLASMGSYGIGFGVVDNLGGKDSPWVPGRSGLIIRNLRLGRNPVTPIIPAGTLSPFVPLPIFWDVTNRTEELFTASADGKVEGGADAGEVDAGEPMATVLNMLNLYFDALIRARENIGFYAWR